MCRVRRSIEDHRTVKRAVGVCARVPRRRSRDDLRVLLHGPRWGARTQTLHGSCASSLSRGLTSASRARARPPAAVVVASSAARPRGPLSRIVEPSRAAKKKIRFGDPEDFILGFFLFPSTVQAGLLKERSIGCQRDGHRWQCSSPMISTWRPTVIFSNN